MKIRLPWIRVTAAAVLVAGGGVHEAAAQYAPYRPTQPQAAPTAAPQQAQVPVVAPPVAQAPAAQAQQPYYTAYRTMPGAPSANYRTPTANYGSPTGAQYTQPTAAYPQYPQTGSQYPATYGAYPHVAQQPTPEAIPVPKDVTAASQPSNSAGPTPAGAMPSGNPSMGGPAPGACGCNAGNYGAGDYFTSPGCGCGATGGYPNCGVCNTCEDCGCDNQWFGGVYMLGMTRTNATPIKLTSEIPGGSAYPYYPTAADTVLTTRDADYGWAPGVEVRLGSTFTIGESCNACQSTCGYNTSCGCNSCAPQQMYAWEVAWWGLDNDTSSQRVDYMPGNPMVGMKNFYGLGYNGMPVNNYYGYPVTANGQAGYPTVEWQRVRTDWKAQNLELNIIRFPLTCGSPCGGGNSCGGCGGYDACGCNSCGCNDSCGLGFSMYGSCGVRYFRIDDDFLYGTYANATELTYDVQVDNSLIGPQVGWTTDYCWGKWNLFCNSTFGIFNNHMGVWQGMYDSTGTYATYNNNGSASDFNTRSSKDSVAFLGELRVGTAYEITCNWRAVVAYRAVAISGVATSVDQMPNDYSDSSYVGIIDSDNSIIIHGVQVGAECRY